MTEHLPSSDTPASVAIGSFESPLHLVDDAARASAGSPVVPFRRIRGVSSLSSDGDLRIFACDADRDCILVLDRRGRVQVSFGSHGPGPGEFIDPSDVIPVWPEFAGEDLSDRRDLGSLIAVADRGNDRVQIFEQTGVLAGVLRESERGPRPSSSYARAGWPFFRVSAIPALARPVALRWQPPLLCVFLENGSMVPVDLASALLPSFDEWIAQASPATLREARKYFWGSRSVVLPADVLERLYARRRGAARRAVLERA